MRKSFTITIHNDVCATVRGHGSRELITSLRGRPPVWSITERGWVIQPRYITDLTALAELKGYSVTVTEAGDPW